MLLFKLLYLVLIFDINNESVDCLLSNFLLSFVIVDYDGEEYKDYEDYRD